MIKSKIVKKRDSVQVIVKTEKDQQINEPELQTLKSGVKGFLTIEVEPRMKKYKISYNATGYIPFKEYLKMPLTSDSLARLLRSTLNILKEMERLYLKQECILFDSDCVYINAMQQSVNFIYVPIRYIETGTRLRDFLLAIIQYGTFDKDEDNTYFKEYIRILNEGMNFSIFDLEEYVKKLENNDFQESNKQVQCIHCKNLLSEKTKFCPICGTKIGEMRRDANDNVYNPLEYLDNPQREYKEIRRVSREESGTQGLSDDTTLLGDYGSTEFQTMLLTERDFFTEHNPYLIRISNDEKVFIKMSEVRIGKSTKENDYIITGNKMVSRKHAEIFVEDESVYVKDIGSLNGTFVNGRRLAENEECKLKNNDKLKFADEEFLFSVED